MGDPVQIPVADAWREHVLASVDWEALKPRLPASEAISVSSVLDLYLGGTIRHEYRGGQILCHGCPYLKNEAGCGGDPLPACACHMGIVRAIARGILGTDFTANREVENNECRLILHPIA